MDKDKTKLIDFLNKYFVDDIKKLMQDNLEYYALIILSQSIETLGAVLDNKPFRAKAQSKKRFDLALSKLFPAKYKKANKDFYLYQILRNHIVHMLVPSSKIKIIDDKKLHLSQKDKQILLSVEQFQTDVENAVKILIKKIKNDKIKIKKLNL